MKNIGDVGYKKIVLDMLNQGKEPDPTTDLGLATQQTLRDVVNLTLSARKARARNSANTPSLKRIPCL